MIDVNLLIPGHLYRDDKGVDIIYVGLGFYRRDDYPVGNVHGYTWQCSKPLEPRYLYMKKSDVDAKIADGRLDTSLTHYDMKKKKGCSADFGRTVLFSKKPRKLVADLGAVYPPNYFKHHVVIDHSCEGQPWVQPTVQVTCGWFIDTI